MLESINDNSNLEKALFEAIICNNFPGLMKEHESCLKILYPLSEF